MAKQTSSEEPGLRSAVRMKSFLQGIWCGNRENIFGMTTQNSHKIHLCSDNKIVANLDKHYWFLISLSILICQKQNVTCKPEKQQLLVLGQPFNCLLHAGAE